MYSYSVCAKDKTQLDQFTSMKNSRSIYSRENQGCVIGKFRTWFELIMNTNRGKVVCTKIRPNIQIFIWHFFIIEISFLNVN